MIKPRKLVGVIGSGTEPCPALSRPLGKWLGERGFDLINGGGDGVMTETAKSFAGVDRRKGLVIGVIPAERSCDSPKDRAGYQPPPDYPNPYTDIVIRTHLHHSGVRGKEITSRNHIIILSADFLIALPGEKGTRSEIELALDYGKPLVIVSPAGEWDNFSTKADVVKTIDEATSRIGLWAQF